jgi:hypothetical protein
LAARSVVVQVQRPAVQPVVQQAVSAGRWPGWLAQAQAAQV